MVTRLLEFLRSLNPFRGYYAYRLRLKEAEFRAEEAARLERQEERQVFLTAIQSMQLVAVESAKATQQQALVMKAHLDSFAVVESPRLRSWDEEADDRRYIESHLPPDLQGKSELEQFSMLIDRLNSGE